MKKALYKKIILSALGVLVLFAGIMVYHIYSALQKQNDFRTSRQLGRIDFTQKIDSLDATSLRYKVAAMEGVESTYFNYGNNILVYTYYLEKQSAESIWNTATQNGKYTAKKYTVNNADLAKGCPAISQNSFTYRTTKFVAQLLN